MRVALEMETPAATRQLTPRARATPQRQWLDALAAVAQDIQTFESANGCRLEQLVETEWQPIAIGRAYDMVFGPKGT